MKSVYILNEDNKLAGKTILNDGEPMPGNMVTVPPPKYDFDLEIPVWVETDWVINLTEKGIERGLFSARLKRNELLSKTDWTQLPDTCLTDQQKQDMMQYRQELRDMFSGVTHPERLSWPKVPEFYAS